MSDDTIGPDPVDVERAHGMIGQRVRDEWFGIIGTVVDAWDGMVTIRVDAITVPEMAEAARMVVGDTYGEYSGAETLLSA